MFYSSQHGEQSSIPSRAAARLGYPALLGPADAARAGSVARINSRVATYQLGRLGRTGDLRSGSPLATVHRGLVCRRVPAPPRRLAQRGHAGGGAPEYKPRIVRSRLALSRKLPGLYVSIGRMPARHVRPIASFRAMLRPECWRIWWGGPMPPPPRRLAVWWELRRGGLPEAAMPECPRIDGRGSDTVSTRRLLPQARSSSRASLAAMCSQLNVEGVPRWR